MDIQIALATTDDLPRLRRVIQRAHLRTKRLEDCRWLVKATAGGAIVGAAGLEVLGPYGFFRSFAVEKAYRKQRVGSAILRRSLELCREAGIDEVYLVTAWYHVPYFNHYGFAVIQRSEIPQELQRHWQVSSALFRLLRSVVKPMRVRLE